MNIILIGYRGTGKSVVARILAQRLKMTCVGMDAAIVQRAGMPIPEIVEKFGWTGFREMETEVALSLAGEDRQIIDTGGGVIERPENMPALQASGPVFWLKAKVETIIRRIRDDDQRPALTAGKSFTDEVAEVLNRRREKYRLAARHAIDTDELTPEEVADEIIAILQARYSIRPL